MRHTFRLCFCNTLFVFEYMYVHILFSKSDILFMYANPMKMITRITQDAFRG